MSNSKMTAGSPLCVDYNTQKKADKILLSLFIIGIIAIMISSSVGAVEIEKPNSTQEEMKKFEDSVMVTLPGRYFTDDNGEPLDQKTLTEQDTEDIIHIINTDGSVTLCFSEKKYEELKEKITKDLEAYWYGLFDENSEYYHLEYVDYMNNKEYTNFTIVVDEDLYNEQMFSEYNANILIYALEQYSIYYQSYSLIPLDEQKTTIRLINEDGELILDNKGNTADGSKEDETATEKETEQKCTIDDVYGKWLSDDLAFALDISANGSLY